MRLSAIGNSSALKRAVDLILKIVPVAGLVSIAAYIAAQQAVSPQRRVVKLAVLIGLMAFMLRFDMVYSVYLFTVLFPFPSGVSIGSTNSILMTVIPLIWAVRAASTKSKFYFRKTNVDFAILLFLLTFVVSFFNVESTPELKQSLKVMWRTVATVMYFYMIVTFVNDERKIVILTKVLAGVCGFLLLTGVVELFFPGANIIPGWIALGRELGEGRFAVRVSGVRVGGVLGSHGMLSDFGTQTLFLMLYFAFRSRNPLERTIWIVIALITVGGILATANRGAFIGFIVGLAYLMYLFRGRISITKMVMIFALVVLLFAATEAVLTRYTYATSLTQRFVATEFEGVVPDNRRGTWLPTIERGLDHPFIGHGPFYDIGEGLEFIPWPHNGYLFYFYTIGIFGLLAYLVVVYKVGKYSLSFKTRGAEGTVLGDISRILHVSLVVMLIEQLRTDHQREDIYPFMMWLLFGLVVATALVIQEKHGNEGGEEEEGDEGGGGGTGGRRKPGLRRRPRGSP